MTRSSSRLTAALTLAFAMAIPLHAQIIIDPPLAAWTLSPENTKADEAFTLSALSYRYTCASSFANQVVNVVEGRINLSFTSSIRPEVSCPANDLRPYGPAFKMPPLKAGKYAVSMNLLLPCHVTQPACRIAIPVEAAGTLIVGALDPVISYVIDPAQVAAGQDFSLNLLSTYFHCNIDFTYLASRVQDGRITLTYLDKANPVRLCLDDKGLYGPAYKMTALKAGTYEVWAERLPACVEQGCKILPIPVLAGKLVVAEGPYARKGWFLKNREVKAGAAFNMGVVSNDYGSCNTEFANTSLVVQDNQIRVSFSIKSIPDRVCIVDIRPHGPTFQVQALKAGRYPLFVQVMPACLFTEPRCELIDIPPIPVPVDTLIVSQSLSLGGPSAPSGQGPAAFFRDGSLSLQLPAGAQGIWRADVLNLSGRRLESVPVAAGEGALNLSLASKPQRGVYMVRLVSPARETHTIRVPVKD